MATWKRTVTLQSATILALEELAINGKLSQGIELLYRDSLLKTGTKAIQATKATDGEGAIEKRHRLAKEKESDEQLALQIRHYKETGQPEPWVEPHSRLTQEMIDAALVEFEAWEVRGRAAEKAEAEARQAAKPKHKTVDWDAFNAQHAPAAVPAKKEPSPREPTLAEYLAANPWPDNDDSTE